MDIIFTQRSEESYFIYLKEQKSSKIICITYGCMGGKTIERRKKVKIRVRITLGGQVGLKVHKFLNVLYCLTRDVVTEYS